MSPSPREPQEPDLLPARSILGIASVCVVIFVAAVFASGLSARSTGARPPRGSAGPAPPTPSGPPSSEEQTLIEDRARGLELRAEQRAALDRYGWVDRQTGVATIPIDR